MINFTTIACRISLRLKWYKTIKLLRLAKVIVKNKMSRFYGSVCICGQLGHEVTVRLVSAVVLSRLDCCNANFSGLLMTTLAPLQRVLNTAARIILDLRLGDHAVRELHWLPVTARIKYKLCLLTHKVPVGQARSTLQISWRRLQKSLPDLHSVRQLTAISLSGQEANTENRRTCFFCRGTASVESAPNRVETVSIDSTVQAQA